jgi:hypothetical protein
MLDELDELRQAVQSGNYQLALALIDEMDEMSRDDKITKIESYMVQQDDLLHRFATTQATLVSRHAASDR